MKFNVEIVDVEKVVKTTVKEKVLTISMSETEGKHLAVVLGMIGGGYDNGKTKNEVRDTLSAVRTGIYNKLNLNPAWFQEREALEMKRGLYMSNSTDD